jgi:hypothetical protein
MLTLKSGRWLPRFYSVKLLKYFLEIEERALLVQYLHRSADIYVNLSSVGVRKLSVNAMNLQLPPNKIDQTLARPDWLTKEILPKRRSISLNL